MPKIGDMQSSVTPILDLLQPLPEPDVERTNGRFALPFLASTAAIVLTGNYSFLVIPFGFLLVNFLATAVHELGHLLAGWSVGLCFKGVRIDPFRLRIDSGKWKFKVRPRLFWGFVMMTLDRVRCVRRRLIIVTAGGPVASLFCGVAAIFAGEVIMARSDSAWGTFLDFFGAWSLLIGCLSLFPFQARGFANDSMLLRGLLFRKAEARQMVVAYALSSVARTGPFLPDYAARWFRMAAISTELPGQNYYADWLAYETEQDPDLAAQHLERCLAQSARMDDDARDMLIAEASVFTAWRRGDLEKAETWFMRVKSRDHLHPIWQARVDIARLCARKRIAEASAELRRALALVRMEPSSAQRQRVETAWVAWSQEIQQTRGCEAAAKPNALVERQTDDFERSPAGKSERSAAVGPFAFVRSRSNQVARELAQEFAWLK